jgi:protoporphyrinogen/coproporphyrinogen III oxidase
MTDVVVVGGGISGLATAWFLQRRGRMVTLLEAGSEPGGTIRTVARDGFLIDTGPTSTLHRGGALGELIKDVGLESEMIEADPRAPRYIMKNDTLVPLPTGPGAFLKTPLFSAGAKWRLLGEPFHGRAENEESIAQFVRRRLGPEFLDWAVDPFVSGVYAGDPERLSVRAAIPRLYALEAEHGSLFIGALARAFRGNPGGAQPRGRLISFRRGLQTLPRAIAATLGNVVRLNARVTALERISSGDWIVRTQSDQCRALSVVLATSAYDAAPLIAPLAVDAARELNAIHYPAVASVALGFRREQVAHPLDGFGALLPRRLARETLGVIFSSTIFPGRAPAGSVLMTAFIGGARNPSVRDRSMVELEGRVLEDLRALLGIRGDPIFRQVTLWPRAIPQYEAGHLERVARIDSALGAWKGLHVRANWRDGVSLADSVQNAKTLALSL